MVDGEEKSQEPQNQSHKKTRESDKHVEIKTQKMSDTSNVLSLFFSLCLVVAAFMTFLAICVQAFIYNAQLKEMKKSTDAAIKAANLAEESVKQSRETSRLDQRAWVGVISVSGNPTLNQPFIVTIQAKNTGKTFAKKLRSNVYYQEFSSGREPDFSSADNQPPPGVQSVTLVAPNGEYAIKTDIFDVPITQRQLDDWKSGQKVFFASGIITYEDVFGVAHWTTFCYYLKRSLDAYSNYAKHNDADENISP
jgi:hypothetical protein